MSNLEAIILGLIQGLTEFLPISSSGHLEIGKTFFEHIVHMSLAKQTNIYGIRTTIQKNHKNIKQQTCFLTLKAMAKHFF